MDTIFHIFTAATDFFVYEGAPVTVFLAKLTIAIIFCMIPLLAWFASPRRERQQVKDYLAEAVGLGHVGEHVSGEDEEIEPENPAMADSMPEIPRMQPKLREHLPRRQALRWLDNNTVQATTRYRRPFYGEVVGRKRGELILQREKGCPIRVRQPQ